MASHILAVEERIVTLLHAVTVRTLCEEAESVREEAESVRELLAGLWVRQQGGSPTDDETGTSYCSMCHCYRRTGPSGYCSFCPFAYDNDVEYAVAHAHALVCRNTLATLGVPSRGSPCPSHGLCSGCGVNDAVLTQRGVIVGVNIARRIGLDLHDPAVRDVHELGRMWPFCIACNSLKGRLGLEFVLLFRPGDTLVYLQRLRYSAKCGATAITAGAAVWCSSTTPHPAAIPVVILGPALQAAAEAKESRLLPWEAALVAREAAFAAIISAAIAADSARVAPDLVAAADATHTRLQTAHANFSSAVTAKAPTTSAATVGVYEILAATGLLPKGAPYGKCENCNGHDCTGGPPPCLPCVERGTAKSASCTLIPREQILAQYLASVTNAAIKRSRTAPKLWDAAVAVSAAFAADVRSSVASRPTLAAAASIAAGLAFSAAQAAHSNLAQARAGGAAAAAVLDIVAVPAVAVGGTASAASAAITAAPPRRAAAAAPAPLLQRQLLDGDRVRRATVVGPVYTASLGAAAAASTEMAASPVISTP